MRKWRIISGCLLMLLLAVLSTSLLVLTRSERSQLTCTGMNVNFMDSLKFVTAGEIKSFVGRNYGVYVGKQLDSVKLGKVEEMLMRSGLIVECVAWMDGEGMMQVDIWQREPVLRFMNGEKGFYVDAGGYVFPLHRSYVADVPVVEGELPVEVPQGFSGYLEDKRAAEWIQGMIIFNNKLQASRNWRSMVEKIYVRNRKDLAMVLSRGPEVFIIGEPQEIDGKFEKIKKYYDYIAPSKSEGYYKSVNLKYKNQIICRQKDI